MAKNNIFDQGFTIINSSFKVSQLKFYDFPQVALFGRSNVGKSSLINNLCRQRHLAKTSKTPGRTASINFFLNRQKNFLLVDLPGYGFAKNNQAARHNWEELLLHYLSNNKLIRAFILIDMRRGLMEIDHHMIKLLNKYHIAFQIILTKSDKLPQKEIDSIINKISLEMTDQEIFHEPIFHISNLKKTGIDNLRGYITKIITKK